MPPTKTARRAPARTAARLGAVQALYQMDLAHSDIADVLAEFSATRLGESFEDGQCGHADVTFLQDIVRGVLRDQRLIDRSLSGFLAGGWKLDRLDSTARAILRAGAYELMFREDVPARAVIAEYVDVAQAFFGGPEPGFINAALDGLARDRRPGELKRA